MTLAQVHTPSAPIEPGELDGYLANGWFRMGQTIFTTHILHYNNVFYSAVWLRIPLQDLKESNTLKKLKKTNAAFKVIIQPASLTAEKEALFEKYKGTVSFEASASLEHLLFGKDLSLNVYNTYEVTLYDGERLIAAGFFDLGKESAAGISSFYDPEYKKHSLGKYLIHLKIEYCQKTGIRYFYPGYFVPGYSIFDYKLEIAKNDLQYYSLETEQWLPLPTSSFQGPLEKMRDRLTTLSEKMALHHLPFILFHYEFYNANLTPEFKGLDLFDFPVFLYCFDPVEDYVNPVVVFDLRDQQYHLIQCGSLFKTEFPLLKDQNYAMHLLTIRTPLFSTAHPQEMIEQLIILGEIISANVAKQRH